MSLTPTPKELNTLKDALLTKIRNTPSYKGHSSIVKEGGFVADASTLFFEFPILSSEKTWIYLHQQGFTVASQNSKHRGNIRINYSQKRASNCMGGKISSSWKEVFGNLKMPTIL